MKIVSTRRVLTMSLLVMLFVIGVSASAADNQVNAGDWTSLIGDWVAENGALVNSDVVNGNTNAYAEVDQAGTVITYTWTAEFRETTFSLGPAAGMHILADDTTDPQRGNSYLVFQDSDFIRIYKATGSLVKVADLPVTAALGDVHTYKVVFNTDSGKMTVYRNDEFVGEWQDVLPLKSGKYISVRTNGTIAAFTNVQVDVE